jgi:hypothetical protein
MLDMCLYLCTVLFLMYFLNLSMLMEAEDVSCFCLTESRAK